MSPIYKVSVTSCLLFVFLNEANAVSMNYSLEGGVYNSDNIQRDTTNIKDTVTILSAGLQVNGQSKTNNIDLLMNVENRTYKNNTYTNDTRGLVDLKSNWGILEKTITWTLNGLYGQTRIDPYTVITPNNLQNVGYFSTGPNASLILTTADRLNFSAYYNQYYAEIANTDNTSGRYNINYTRDINTYTSVSLNTNYNDVNYDDPGNLDFTRFDYFINFTRSTSISELRINYGTSDLEFETADTLNGDFKRLSFSYKINRSNSVELGFVDEIDDGASNLDGTTVDSTIAAGNLFRNQAGLLGYQYKRDPIYLGFIFRYADEDFLATDGSQDDFDRKLKSGRINAVFGSGQNLQLTLSFLRENFDYYVRGQDDTEDTMNIRLSKRLGGNVSIGLEGQRFTRESVSSTPTQDITENQYMIFVSYQSRNH